jgi:metal-sulfur cluster biosynthetic enzyme
MPVASTNLVDETEVRRILDEIKDPCSVAASVPMGLDEMGIVKSVAIDGNGRVSVELRLTSPFCEMISFMRNEALAKIGNLPGVRSVAVTHDSGLDWDHDLIAPAAQARRQRRLDRMRDIHLASAAGRAVAV